MFFFNWTFSSNAISWWLWIEYWMNLVIAQAIFFFSEIIVIIMFLLEIFHDFLWFYICISDLVITPPKKNFAICFVPYNFPYFSLKNFFLLMSSIISQSTLHVFSSTLESGCDFFSLLSHTKTFLSSCRKNEARALLRL